MIFAIKFFDINLFENFLKDTKKLKIKFLPRISKKKKLLEKAIRIKQFFVKINIIGKNSKLKHL